VQCNTTGRESTNDGELAAFVAYAQAFPTSFLALIDTYDVLKSGLWNYICVALALFAVGYRPAGVRLDSGDLAYLSNECRRMLREMSASDVAVAVATDDANGGGDGGGEGGTASHYTLHECLIVASNSISESVLHSLNEQVGFH
jgi:nicotinate phosphoribosyltransferase